MVEVADSSLRLDRGFKAALYAEARIAEYWIVNLVDRTIEVHRDPLARPNPTETWKYSSLEVRQPPDTVTPLAAPAARIAIADLLA